MILLLLSFALSYLAGSIPTALIVGWVLGGYDIRTKGSGNAGATNVYRLFGMKPYLFTLVLDVFKGYAAVAFIAPLGVGVLSDERTGLYCGLMAVVGHIWTIFARFRGGKGVGTAAGMFLALAPYVAIGAIAVYLAITLTTQYVALGSMSGALSAPLLLALKKFVIGAEVPPELMVMAIAMAALIVYTHRANIERLRAGTESKTDFLEKLRKKTELEPLILFCSRPGDILS